MVLFTQFDWLFNCGYPCKNGFPFRSGYEQINSFVLNKAAVSPKTKKAPKSFNSV
jgi:hypothetical protein